MDRTMSFNYKLVAFGIPLLLMLSVVLLSQSDWFQQHPESLSTAITFDLAMIIPLVYLFLIWKKPIPKYTTTPVFIAGLILASYIIPASHQFYLGLIKQWVVPLVELTVLTFIVLKVRKIYKAYKVQKNNSFDFHTVIQQASREVVPKGVASILSFEISLIYYGFLNWKQRKLASNEFSYHNKTGTIAILSVLILIIWVETFVIHILLQRWSPLMAWILTGISLYSGFQVFGMLRSLSKRPISIEKDVLQVRYGIMSEATIPLENIDSITVSSKQHNFDKETRKLSPLGDLESHNVLIHLKNEGVMEGLYGMKKKFKTLALHIDEKAQFELAVRTAIQGKKKD